MVEHVIKIGDFSKICQVSVKALRHWDKVDLLKPAVTDEQSGYRYYAIEQVATVNRILALKIMGLSLTQISELIHDEPTADDIRAMLKLKKAQLQQDIDQAENMLTAVEARLKVIEHKGKMPEYEVTTKPVPSLNMLAIRETSPTMTDLVDLLRDVHPYAINGKTDNMMAIFHDDHFAYDQIDIEIGFPVEDESEKAIPLDDNRKMTVQTLPAVELMACTVHRGAWSTLVEGYNHIGHWINNNGYQIVGAGREIFHHIGWQDQDRHTTVTEIQFPIQQR